MAFPLYKRNQKQDFYVCPPDGKSCIKAVFKPGDRFLWDESDTKEGYVPLKVSSDPLALPTRLYLDPKKCELYCGHIGPLATQTLAMDIPRLLVSKFATSRLVSAPLSQTHPRIARSTSSYVERAKPEWASLFTEFAHPEFLYPCNQIFGENILSVVKQQIAKFRASCLSDPHTWRGILEYVKAFFLQEFLVADTKSAVDTKDKSILFYNAMDVHNLRLAQPVISGMLTKKGGGGALTLERLGSGSIGTIPDFPGGWNYEKKEMEKLFHGEIEEKKIGLYTIAAFIQGWLQSHPSRNVAFCIKSNVKSTKLVLENTLENFVFHWVGEFLLRDSNVRNLYLAPWNYAWSSQVGKRKPMKQHS